MVDAERENEGLDLDHLGGLVLESEAGPGVLLMAGHRRDAVVQDDRENVRLVVGDVGQGGQARVVERRVADHGDHALADAGLRRSVCDADAGAHAAAGVDCRQRREQAQGVAADVPCHGHLLLREELEDAAVRAPRAQYRRTRR